MNEELREQLSALVDDELTRSESAFLVRRLARDEASVDQLGRYFLISDALRGQLPETLGPSLAERVSAALREEPPLAAPRMALGRRFAKPLAGAGIAASVAMLAVSLWSPEPGSQMPAQQGFVAAGAAQPVSATPPRDQWERLDPEVQQRLNAYLVNHSEHSATGRFGGVFNFVRIAGQQERDRD